MIVNNLVAGMIAAVDLRYIWRSGSEMIAVVNVVGKLHSRAGPAVGIEAATNSQPDGSWSTAKFRRAQLQDKAAVVDRKAPGFEQLVDRTERP